MPQTPDLLTQTIRILEPSWLNQPWLFALIYGLLAVIVALIGIGTAIVVLAWLANRCLAATDRNPATVSGWSVAVCAAIGATLPWIPDWPLSAVPFGVVASIGLIGLLRPQQSAWGVVVLMALSTTISVGSADWLSVSAAQTTGWIGDPWSKAQLGVLSWHAFKFPLLLVAAMAFLRYATLLWPAPPSSRLDDAVFGFTLAMLGIGLFFGGFDSGIPGLQHELDAWRQSEGEWRLLAGVVGGICWVAKALVLTGIWLRWRHHSLAAQPSPARHPASALAPWVWGLLVLGQAAWVLVSLPPKPPRPLHITQQQVPKTCGNHTDA